MRNNVILFDFLRNHVKFKTVTFQTEKSLPPHHRKKSTSSVKSETKEKKAEPIRAKKIQLRRVKSRELYSGSVYIDCDCYHRNGLQHDCPRTSCGGHPPCIVKPWPECDLGTYFMDKWEKYYDHLDTIPPTSFCGSKEAWLAIVEEERRKRAKDKCHEELLPQSKETGNGKQSAEIVHSKKLKDTACEHSVTPDGLAKEYVMIPVKVTSKEMQSVKKDKSSPIFCDSGCHGDARCCCDGNTGSKD
ncbi:uncharacterized protein LOC143209988 [Lasioglossum baleicum]|uniref:uncharacterized protein LOC143209988 n=1 Tax=Lasioglossum baleicum TaxID=434251 RepID=UPI003FCC2D08